MKPILYFIAGKVPTNKEFVAASQFMNKGPVLQFISLVDFDLNSGLIENEGVAGLVPELYKKSKRVDIVTAPETPSEKPTVGNIVDLPKAK